MDQEARDRPAPVPVRVPVFMKEIVAALTAELRRSPHVNHRSGISVRYSIGNLETLQAAAVRRAARTGEPEAVPRVVDLPAVLMSSEGRVEFDTIEEGREAEILSARGAHRRARGVPPPAVRATTSHHCSRGSTRGSRSTPASSRPPAICSTRSATCPGLAKLLERLGVEEESPGVAASALEFALEGLYLSRRLNKDGGDRAARYSDPRPPEARPRSIRRDVAGARVGRFRAWSRCSRSAGSGRSGR